MRHTHTCTKLTEGVQSVLQLKIVGYSVTEDTIGRYNTCCIKSKFRVDGFDWEICFYPADRYGYLYVCKDTLYILTLELVFLGNGVTEIAREASRLI
ncbi:unnamed protein product [Urochloa humidicola]